MAKQWFMRADRENTRLKNSVFPNIKKALICLGNEKLPKRNVIIKDFTYYISITRLINFYYQPYSLTSPPDPGAPCATLRRPWARTAS